MGIYSSLPPPEGKMALGSSSASEPDGGIASSVKFMSSDSGISRPGRSQYQYP